MSKPKAYFDLETAEAPPEWDGISRIPITCAALLVDSTISDDPDEGLLQFWYAGMGDDKPTLDEAAKGLERGSLIAEEEMSPGEVWMMVRDIAKLLNILVPEGGELPLFTWNGAHFDFAVMDANLPAEDRETRDMLRYMTLRSYDPCLQFCQTFGWPIGLAKTAQAVIGAGKFEDMDGALAAQMWPAQAGKVLRYVRQDVYLLRDVVNAIQAERQVRWIKGNGQEGAKPVSSWLTVSKIMDLPEPNRKWMDGGGEEFKIKNITAWMKLD